MIFGLGIEKKDDTYIAHAQNIKYAQTEGKRGYDFELVKVEAANVYELVRKLTVLNEKSTLWKHLQTIIIHETIDLNSLLELSDFLERSPDIPINFAIVYTKEKLEEIMKLSSGTFIIPAMSIYSMLLEENRNIAVVPVRFTELSRSIQEKFRDLHMPMMHIENENVIIAGTLIFMKNGNVSTLTSDETRSLMRIKGKLYTIVETFVPGGESAKEISFATSVEKSNVKLKATLENGQPIVHVHIRETYNLEVLSPHKHLSKADLQKFNTTYQDHIQQKLETMITKVQQMPANILGFAQLIEREHPAYWKTHQQNWDTLYPKLTVRVTVEAKYNHSGLIENHQKSSGKE